MVLDFLLSPNPLSEIHKVDSFLESITARLCVIADQHHCNIKVCEDRLYTAFDLWIRDTRRVLNDRMPPDTEKLDHFKQAAFLAFWIRRSSPITDINWHAHTWTEIKTVQEFFTLYGNELCASIIAYEISLNYQRNILKREFEDNPSLAAKLSNKTYPDEIPEGLLVDLCVVLKHKNNSPHSLYLILYALFSGYVLN